MPVFDPEAEKQSVADTITYYFDLCTLGTVAFTGKSGIIAKESGNEGEYIIEGYSIKADFITDAEKHCGKMISDYFDEFYDQSYNDPDMYIHFYLYESGGQLMFHTDPCDPPHTSVTLDPRDMDFVSLDENNCTVGLYYAQGGEMSYSEVKLVKNGDYWEMTNCPPWGLIPLERDFEDYVNRRWLDGTYIIYGTEDSKDTEAYKKYFEVYYSGGWSGFDYLSHDINPDA